MRSGSLVTAHQAAELGRAVFAVPGPVTSSQSTGANLLLSDGAVPALDAAQILAELGVAPRPRPRAGQPQPLAPAARPAAQAAPVAPVDPVGVLVREALPTLRSGRASEVLELAAETGLEPARVLATLGLLAALGQAVKTGAGWALK